MDDWILLSIAAADFDAFSAFDFMLSIGVRPLVELSFTPDPLNKDWVSQPASQAATKRYCMACLSFVMPGNFDHLGDSCVIGSRAARATGLQPLSLWYDATLQPRWQYIPPHRYIINS